MISKLLIKNKKWLITLLIAVSVIVCYQLYVSANPEAPELAGCTYVETYKGYFIYVNDMSQNHFCMTIDTFQDIEPAHDHAWTLAEVKAWIDLNPNTGGT